MTTNADFAHALRLAADRCELRFRSYSGRGMCGHACVAVVIEGRDDLWALAQALADEGFPASRVPAGRTDALGRNTIIYWPRVEMPATFGA